MEHLLFAWLVSQPEDVRALIHCLSRHHSLQLTWDPLHHTATALTDPEGARVLSALNLPLVIVTTR